MVALSVLPFWNDAFGANGNDTWQGSADNNWATAANWSPAVNAPPIGGDWLYFGAAGLGTALTNNLGSGTNFSGITFNSGASAFSIVGDPIVLAGGITNNSSVAQTISLAVTNTTTGRPLMTATGGGNVILNGGLYGTGGSFLISGGGTAVIGGTNNTQTGTTTVTNANLSLAAANALPVAQLSLLGSIPKGGLPGTFDLNGFNQTFSGGSALFGTDANNEIQTGSYITNSSPTLAVLTLTNVGNDYQFREGNIGGNIELVIRASSLNGNASAAGFGFQQQVAGNTYAGGTLISGVGTTPLTTANLAIGGDFVTTGVGSCSNTAAFRFYGNSDYYLSGGLVFGTGPITLDNGELWSAGYAYYVTNPISITSRGGILRSENDGLYWRGPVSGTGLLALCTSKTTMNFSNDFSGFTGTLAVDTGSGAGVGKVNLDGNSPSCNLLFWGNGARTGIVQWNGSTVSPMTLAFGEVNCGATKTAGALSCANATSLTYQLGDDTSTTNIFGGVVENGGGSVGITKIGTDSQILSGLNTYTNPTYVGGGELVLSGVNNGGGGCVVSNGATLSFGGSGSLTNATAAVSILAGGTMSSGGAFIGGLVDLGPGNAAISLQDNIIDTNTLAGGLTLNGGNILQFEIGGASDVIAMAGGVYTKNPGTVTVNVTGSGFGVGTYPLITGVGIASTNGFVLGIAPSNPSFKYSLVVDASGDLALQVSLGVVVPATTFWKGGVDNNWSTPDILPNFNWAADSTGATTAGAKPGVITAVTFSAAGAANQETVLGGNFEINSLTLSSPANIGIGGGNTLQLDSGGLTINSGAGNLTISNSSLVVGGSQLWTNNSTSTLDVTAPISGLSTLTLGGGNTMFSGANSQSGIAVTAGNLTLSGAGTLGSSTATVTVNGGAVDLGGSSQSVGQLSLQNGGAITNGSITGTGFDLQSGTIAAVMGGGAVNAVKSTSGTVILSANNPFSGTMNVGAGTLQIGAGGATGSLNEGAMVISNGASLVFNSSGAQTNSASPSGISGSGPISVLGGGSVTINNNANSFTGNILVDGSALIAAGANNTANETAGVLGNPSVIRTITLTNGAALSFQGGNVLGGWASTRCDVDISVNQACQLALDVQNANGGDSNPLGEVDLNGGTMLVGNGYTAMNQGAILLSNVYVGGSSPSFILANGSDATRDGINLGAYNVNASTNFGAQAITFYINSTGGSGPDLTVSASLVDPPFASSLGTGALFTNTAGGLYKDGPGTMALTAINSYTGPTIVNAGKLVVSSIQGLKGMTNNVELNSGVTLGVVVAGTNQWSPSAIVTAGPVTNEFTGLTSTNSSPLNPGSVTLGGGVIVNVYGALAVGQYPLVANDSGDIASYSIGALPMGSVASLGTSGTAIVLNVTTASAPFLWTGNNNGNWDTTTTNNWQANGLPEIYQDVEPVQFNDNAARTAVSVVGTVLPASMIVSNESKTYTFAGGIIGGSVMLTKDGNGTLILENTNSYTGGTVISNGVIQLGNGVGNMGVIPGNVFDNGQLAFFNASNQSFSGAISGSGSMLKSAAGTLTLTASNSYSGGTILANGAVILPAGSSSPFGTGALILSNGTAIYVQPTSLTGGGVLLEHNVIVPSGTSSLIDDSANAYGNVWLGSDTAQWSGSGTVNFQNNGSNPWTAALWTGNPFTNFSGTIDIGSTNSGQGMFNGFGYNGASGQYSSPATVDASSVAWQLGDVGFSKTFAINNCVLVELGSISAVNPATEIQGNSSAPCGYVIGALNTSTTFAGFMDDGPGGFPVALTKVGLGTLTLSGTNSYTGNTDISGGTLVLAQTFSTLNINSTVIISNGASLDLLVASVTNHVSSLILNGTAVANGFYGSANSPGYITGGGILQVGTIVGPSGPGVLTNSYNPGTHVLSLAWPSGQNWRLQMQTNSLAKGLGTNWMYVTDGSVNATNITVDPANPTVFYRLSYP